MQKMRLLNFNRIGGQSQILQVEPALNEGCLNVAKNPSDTSGRYGRTSGLLTGHSLALPTWWDTFRLGQYWVFPPAAAPEKFWSDPEADDLLSAQVWDNGETADVHIKVVRRELSCCVI